MGRVGGTHWIRSTATLTADVQVYENISGHSLTFLVAEIPCALPTENGENVIVFEFYGEILALPADLYESHFRISLEFAR